MEVVIRSEIPEDFEKISKVIEASFNQKNEAILVNKLRNTKEYLPDLSLVALVDDVIVGQILFYPIPMMDEVTLILAPMCVKPELQRKGIGKKLVKEGLDKAKELGYGSVIVVGHPDYYPKFGFQKASKWGIKLTFEVPEEAFMAMELRRDSLKDQGGLVELPQPYLDCE
jgi:predicted N-acetyltransferase YhbS